MVKFGERIVSRSQPGWENKYVNYNELKDQLYGVASLPPRMHAEGDFKFKKAVDTQLSMINTFFNEKLTDLEESLHPGRARPANATKEGWAITADKASALLIQLEEYAFLNYEGFRKILKKHDKLLKVKMMDAFMVDLDFNDESFWKRSRQLRKCVDMISALYEKSGRYDNLHVNPLDELVSADDDFAEGDVKKSFVRKNSKYWVPRNRVYELFVRLAAYMPLYYFSGNKVDPLTTSVYMENEGMEIFARRIGRKDQATLTRFRVYGDNRPSPDGSCFVERKIHLDKMYGGSSKKERFQIKEVDVDACMSGALVPLANEGKNDRQLATEISEEIKAMELAPFITTRYRRTVFQMNTDDRLRISIDTGLVFTKEYHIPNWNWYEHLGRIPSPSEYSEFPYAVMELKLRDIKMPDWFQSMIAENLVREVPKFSKFGHGCVTFRGTKNIPEVPYWIIDYRDEFEIFDDDSTQKENQALPAAESENQNQLVQFQEKPRFEVVGAIQRFFQSRAYSRLSEHQVVVHQKTGAWRPTAKVDAKAFLANERTYLNWNQQSVTLCTFGIAMYQLSSGNGPIAGFIMTVSGILVLIYGQYQFYRRWSMLRDRESGLRFLDSFGPPALTILLTLTFVLAMVFQTTPFFGR
eukprot:c20530_g1_i2.p1 GENE.c20530_g1_i2~~c20530_g1_i2.p1  ORF type:complete len:639 (+),score=222.48 c20530_g1_i2:1161-3077(+)